MPRKTTATPVATPAAPPVAAPAAAPIGKSATTHLFARTKEERRSALTHEQIENDLDAFARAGGKIEVLGTTFTFKSIGPKPSSGAPTAISPPSEAPPATEKND